MKLVEIFRSAVLALAFLILPHFVFSQSATAANDSVLVINPVPVSDIPVEIEEFNARVKEIEKSIKPSQQIMDLDSGFIETKKYLGETKDKLDKVDLNDLNLRTADNYKREWMGYKEALVSTRSRFNDRIQELQKIVEELNTKEKIWNKTLAAARKENVAGELINSSSEVLTSIDKLKKDTKKQQDLVLKVYKSVTKEIEIVDEVIAMLDDQLKQLQAMLFVLDSPPLWASVDSTSNPAFLKNQIVKTINENARIINVYLSTNLRTLYFQVAFIILLLFLFFYLKRKTNISSINEQNKDEHKAVITLQRPISSALVLGILISMFFYSNRPLPLMELFMIIYMIPVAFLTQKLIQPKFKTLVYAILALFVLTTIESYVYMYAFANRILLIIFAVVMLYALLVVYKNKASFLNISKAWVIKAISLILVVFMVLIVFSTLGFIAGSVDFSFNLLTSVIRSVVFAVVSSITITTLISLLIILTRESKGHHNVILSRYQTLLIKRLKPLIEFSGFVFWVYVTLAFFNIYNSIIEWIGMIMDASLSFGPNVEISVGGVFSFIIILVIAFVLARMIKVVFADDWVLRSKIPRGVPQAISMTLRYVIVGFGIYLALMAADVDLNRFGLIAGALGVGIGFGLQGVVYNFIAGLILSYERPIRVGDTVEVNTLMGNVTEIGVRASKILTFDGSEVIVPNGNLISNQVINWTLSDQQRRLKIPIRTNLEADPRVVIKILREIAAGHLNTLTNPAPMVLFEGYGNASLDFTMMFWVPFNVGLSTKSDVALQVYDALKEAGYDVPIPLQKIHYTSDENVDKEKLPPMGSATGKGLGK